MWFADHHKSFANTYLRLNTDPISQIDFSGRNAVCPKVDVAPKVGLLPQKSFPSAIPFADYDLPAAVSEFVLRWPLGFYFGRCWVGLKSTYGWFN